MKPINRQHMVATIFPASMLDTVRRQSEMRSRERENEIIFLTGAQSARSRCVRLIAEEFERTGKSVRIVRTL